MVEMEVNALADHKELSDKYYIDKSLSKEEFDEQHAKLWTDHEEEIKGAEDYGGL